MKIAVAFFGIPRNSQICYPSIQQRILDVLPAEAQVSCYYHLYEQGEVVSTRSGEKGVLCESNYADFSWMHGLLEAPGQCLERWDFETIKSFGDTWGDDFGSIRNLIHQLNSLYRVTELLAPSQPDFVIYARPDIFYHDDFPTFPFAKPEARRKSVYIPNWQWWGGLNDRFAICGADAYRSYGCRVERMLEYCQREKRGIHSERLLKYVLQRDGLRVCTLDATASRVRIDGQFAEESFSSKRSMGKRENRFFHKASQLRSWFDRMSTR